MRQLFMLMMLFLAGCEAEKPIQIAYNCPAIKLPKLPKDPTAKLTANSSPADTVRAVIAKSESLEEWISITQKQVGASD